MSGHVRSFLLSESPRVRSVLSLLLTEIWKKTCDDMISHLSQPCDEGDS